MRPPVAPPVPPVPNFGFQLQNYAGRVRALSIVWFVYGGLLPACSASLGLTFANAFLHGGFGPWGHGPWRSLELVVLARRSLRFVWSILLVRSGLALIAGWGLMERTQWGRVVAIVAGISFLSSESPSAPPWASGPW